MFPCVCVSWNPKEYILFHMSTPMNHTNELVITWLQASRGLMWTEFVPMHRVQEELDRVSAEVRLPLPYTNTLVS